KIFAKCNVTISQNAPVKAVTWENAPAVKIMIPDNTSATRTAAKLDEVDNPYSRYLFEKTGIKVILERQVGEGTQYDEKVYLTLASGNAPDLLYMGGNDQFCMKITRAGALSPINDSFGKYPNLQKVYNDDYWKEYSFDSNKYVLKNSVINPLAMRCTLIRQDWLDKLQLKMPATVDELYNTVKTFISAKPDGQPVMGLTGRSNFSYFYTLSAAYGCASYDPQFGFAYVDKANKKLVFWGATDAARAYYAQAAKWYKDGLIDPELVTAQGANFFTKINRGNVGVISYRADAAAWATTMVRTAQKRSEPLLAVLPALGGTGFKNSFGSEGKLEVDQAYEGYWGIPRGNKNMENTLKLLDFESSPEFLDFRVFGIEGIESKIVNGKKVFDKENANKVSFSQDYCFTFDRTAITPEQQDAIDLNSSGGGDPTYDPLDQAL
ncbi:MAG: extracellular solute-binding protein, partial [Clostridiales bacterium]|nr:extracellular solute-binding protein [Clostridiales bacterium]